MKIWLLVMLLLLSGSAPAQDNGYNMSGRIDYARTGWNKVLCMKNGYTLLFHFDMTKPVGVKVFDSLHKLVDSREHLCSILDINTIELAAFKGLFEINGEAVLFVQQEHLSRYGLVRLRFDGKTGQLLEEKLLKESPSVAKRTHFYVMNNKGEDNYAILYSTDVPQFYKCEVDVAYYNNRHEAVKQIALPVDRKNYDYMTIGGAENSPTGVCVVLNLTKSVMNATMSGLSPVRAIYNYTEAIYYIPKGADQATVKMVDMSTDINPYYSHVTYNPFANAMNILLFSYRPLFYKFGLDVRRGQITANIFYKLDADNGDLKLNWINNTNANNLFKKATDTLSAFCGMPMAMFTNKNGLTTLVTEGYDVYDEPETRRKYTWDTYFGDIAITQVDDDGNEIWGTLLPHSEYLKSYRHSYNGIEIAKKGQSHLMFDDRPEQITEREFVSLNTYYRNNDLFVVFNDDALNYQNIKELRRDTIFSLEKTNACYYKMNSKKEITKNYLLGEPGKDEYKCSFIGSADFDSERGVYATLIQYTMGDNKELRMAWARLN